MSTVITDMVSFIVATISIVVPAKNAFLEAVLWNWLCVKTL